MGNGEISLKNAAEMCARTFTVVYEGGSENIWIRTLNAAEMDEMQDAIAESRIKIRKKYAEGECRREALLAEINSMQSKNLADLVMQPDIIEFSKKAKRRVPDLMPLELPERLSAAERLQREEKYTRLLRISLRSTKRSFWQCLEKSWLIRRCCSVSNWLLQETVRVWLRILRYSLQ